MRGAAPAPPPRLVLHARAQADLPGALQVSFAPIERDLDAAIATVGTRREHFQGLPRDGLDAVADDDGTRRATAGDQRGPAKARARLTRPFSPRLRACYVGNATAAHPHPTPSCGLSLILRSPPVWPLPETPTLHRGRRRDIPAHRARRRLCGLRRRGEGTDAWHAPVMPKLPCSAKWGFLFGEPVDRLIPVRVEMP
jgi:hypothetical protein